MDQLLLVLQETQYTQMKQKLYKRLFKELIKFFMLVPVVEIARSLISTNIQVFTVSLGMAIMGAVLLGFVSRMQKHQDIAITVLVIFIYTVVISSNYYLQTSLFSNVQDSFHFGCISIGFGAALANRIPKFSHRAIFNILLVVIRLIVVPVEDVSTLPGEFILLCFGLYLDFDREKNDQKLFGSHFYSKEQLTRFKDLVVNDIPDSLIIVNHELSSCLFANNAFTKLWDDTEKCPTHISACLDKFFIIEGLSETSFHSDQNPVSHPPSDRQTLLQFLQQTFLSHSEIHPNKASCNVSYIKSTNLKEHNTSFEHLQNPTELSFEVKILSLVWDQKPAIGIILHDITQQNTILRLKIAANAQKDRILATVSHELRTPLNSILGMVQIMQQKTQDTDMQRYLKICSSSGSLLLGLVNSILDSNMIKANKLKLNIEEVDIRELIQDISKLFEYQCSHKRIYLKLKVSSLIPKMISTDKNRLSQILINLMGNALKFTVNGGITVSLGLSLSSPQCIFVYVEDTGIGIKEEDKGKLFKMFGKLDQQHKGTVVNNQGVGLGLTISNAIAKLLCSNKEVAGIKVESNFNKGSKFSFLIDKRLDVDKKESILDQNEMTQSLTSVDEGEMESKTLDSYRNTFTPGKKTRHFDFNIPEVSKSSFRPQQISKTPENRTPFLSPNVKLALERRANSSGKQAPCILVVDDNPLNMTVVEFFIRRLGFQVKMALSGELAIKTVKENDYDVEEIKMILMDLQMPIMDGYQTTRRLKEMMDKREVPVIPIVALSANDSENDKKMCLEAGMVDYLSKPLKDEELKIVIGKYVD